MLQGGGELIGSSHIHSPNIQVQSRISLIHRHSAPKEISLQHVAGAALQSSGTQGKQIHKAVWTSVLLSSLWLLSSFVISGQMLGCDVQGGRESKGIQLGLKEKREQWQQPQHSALLVCAMDGAALARSQRLKGGGDSRGDSGGDSRGDAYTHTQENVAHT